MNADDCCLVTGAAGFAGQHLVHELREGGRRVHAPSHGELELLDAAAVRSCIREARPSHVFHLAALASVARSWERAAETLCANQTMTVNVLEAVRHEAPDAAVLLASSGEVYGAPENLPVTEEAPLRPRSPYGISKVGSELVADLYAEVHGLRIVRTRAFNHAGPKQSRDYVVGDLACQIAEAERDGRTTVHLRTGNPDAARDFCDVRDVARAYRMAIEAPPGAYNVASGRAVTVGEILSILSELTRLEVEHQVDAGRLRPDDPPCVEGSAARLESATGWRPEIPLRQTLGDALAACRDELGASGG